MFVKLYNDFHNTEVTLRVSDLPVTLSSNQIRRARKELCGVDGCTCGGPLGERGPQDVVVDAFSSNRIILA